MGREIYRVPLTFNWPEGKVWEGFVNPHFRPCPKEATGECHGGWSSAGKWLDAISRFIALIGEQAVEEPFADKFKARGTIYPHPYLQGFQQAPRTEMPREVVERLRVIEDDSTRMREFERYLQKNPPQLLPFTEEMVEFVTGLAGQKPAPPFGNNLCGAVQTALLKAAGIDPDSKWGQCRVCDGHGIDPAVYKLYDEWRRESPPKGEGWQLWETVSEGSPISPVFATAQDLIDWMSQPEEEAKRRGRGGYLPWAQGYKREHAEAFVRGPGWAPSMVAVSRLCP